MDLNLLLPNQALSFGFVARGRRHLVGVVAVAVLTFDAEPVERRPRAAAAVVAADIDSAWAAGAEGRAAIWVLLCFGFVGLLANNVGKKVSKLLFIVRHGLRANLVVQFPPLQLHVHGAFATKRTLVRDAHEFLVAFAMHVMSARHAHGLPRRLEKIVQTKRAVTLSRSFHTWMFGRS